MSILIPYWHQGDAAREVLEEVWQYLKVFEKEAGYIAYDPQLEKPLDLSTDLDEAVAAYSARDRSDHVQDSRDRLYILG